MELILHREAVLSHYWSLTRGDRLSRSKDSWSEHIQETLECTYCKVADNRQWHYRLGNSEVTCHTLTTCVATSRKMNTV